MNRLKSAREDEFFLPGGLRLGYAEYGAPNGSPVLFFHGAPGAINLGTGRLSLYCRDYPVSGRQFEILTYCSRHIADIHIFRR